MMLPLKVRAASGLNITWNAVLLRGLMEMGIAPAITTNSGRLLVTCWIVVLWRLLFVTSTVIAPLTVFIVTDPKFNAVGATPTPASVGLENKIEPIKKIPTNRHTNRVLAI